MPSSPTSAAPDLLRWMSAIDELAIAVNQQRDLPGLLRQIARTAGELLGYESAAVLLVDDDRTALRIEGSWGLSESYLRLVNEESPLLLAPSDAFVGSPSRRAFVDGEPVIVEDISHDPSYGPWAKAAEEHGHHSMAAVPLRNQGETVGTMNVYGSDPRRLGPGGLELLQVLASHAGIALETGAQLERDRRRVRELSALNELLRQHAAIHDRFVGVARRGSGVTDIATELAEITDRAVAVQDVSGQILAAVPRAGVSVRPPDWLSQPRQPGGGDTLLDRLAHASPVPASESFPGLLAAPVRVGEEMLGVLWLAGEGDDDLHLRAVEQAAVVLGLEMLRRRAVTDAQWQLRGDLVAELAGGPLADPEAVIARADRLGSDLRLPQRVLAVQSVLAVHGDGAVRSDRAGEADTAQLLRLVQSLVLARPRPRPLLALRDGAIVVVAPAADPRGVEEFARHIRTVAGQAMEGDVRVAVSETSPTPDQLPGAFRLALGLLRLIPYAPDEDILTVTTAGMIGMLLADVDPQRMGVLAERWIGPLRDYDRRRATDLVTTLRTYLDHDLNTHATAEALYIHPNTVGLRVKRIESLLGVSLTSVGDLTTLRAALAIDDITRTI
ncbi:helix-turn-helix domain-containing protein [Streptomyces sp. NPDC058464]|uniref:helix-turn-helix domain-containing protein n=1 Tax=Streptomyces sp. NPDC058464 TaxID=3346511 RepID=UPI0036512C87